MKTSTTSNAQHTPGPWFDTPPRSGVATDHHEVTDQHGSVVALIPLRGRSPWEQEAIARLIAAAPDLLAALLAVHQAWETQIDARSRYAHVVRAALRKAGAIAKATGAA